MASHVIGPFYAGRRPLDDTERGKLAASALWHWRIVDEFGERLVIPVRTAHRLGRMQSERVRLPRTTPPTIVLPERTGAL